MWTYIYILSASLKKKRLCEIKKKIKVKYGDAFSIIDVQTKYGDPRLYGNRETDIIMKTWCKFNNFNDDENEVKFR